MYESPRLEPPKSKGSRNTASNKYHSSTGNYKDMSQQMSKDLNLTGVTGGGGSINGIEDDS